MVRRYICDFVNTIFLSFLLPLYSNKNINYLLFLFPSPQIRMLTTLPSPFFYFSSFPTFYPSLPSPPKIQTDSNKVGEGWERKGCNSLVV